MKKKSKVHQKQMIIDVFMIKKTYLLHSSYGENRKTRQVVEVSKQDGLLYQEKFVRTSFQVNATHKFAQHQNHKTLLYNPKKIGKQIRYYISKKKKKNLRNIQKKNFNCNPGTSIRNIQNKLSSVIKLYTK